MIRRPQRRYNKNPARRKQESGPGGANKLTQRTPIIPVFSATTTTFQTVTFDQAVIVAGTPALFDSSSPTITATDIESLSPTSVKITWSAAPTAAATWPFEDPAIRNNAGGYVQPGQYTF